VKIVFTPSARDEFLSALGYISKDDPAAARRFRKRVEESLRRLKRFPNSGRRIPELPELPQREVVVAPYRFFYQVIDKTVWIVAVWHGAQLPEEPG
jgi:toxin ParE1/3/4